MKYGIISDVHSNLEALEAVLKVFSQEGVNRYICPGDIVGYGANPKECIEIIKGLNPIIIAGNHDWGCVERVSLEYFNQSAKEAILWTQGVLSEEEKGFLSSLELVHEEESFTVVHGTLYEPEKFHYIIGMLGIYGVVKAGFSILTHLKVPGGALEITWTPFFYNWLYFSNYLFFAGNVGLAYLGYLVYRENRFLRYFMLISSFLFAASALLMHRHYSIDVLSAYFITYGIYKAGNFIFRER